MAQVNGPFGNAQTGAFLLNEASVFIGPQSSLYTLTAANLVGLVKNFTMKYDASFVELGQGVLNLPVASVLNKSKLSASFELFEYNAKNIAYSLNLPGQALTYNTTANTATLASAIAGTVGTPAVSITLSASLTGAAAGSWIMVQGASADQIYFDVITGTPTTTVTLTHGIPDAVAAAGSTVRLLNNIALASTAQQQYFSMVAVSTLADGTPIGVRIPKVRFTKGFSLMITSKDFGNLPFEATVYNTVSGDPGYSEYGSSQASLFIPS